MNRTIRQVRRNVKRWRDAKMALRWTGAAMLEAAKGFRRLKPHKHYRSRGQPWRPIRPATSSTPTLNNRTRLRSLLNQQCLPNEFQQMAGHSPVSMARALNNTLQCARPVWRVNAEGTAMKSAPALASIR